MSTLSTVKSTLVNSSLTLVFRSSLEGDHIGFSLSDPNAEVTVLSYEQQLIKGKLEIIDEGKFY